jgi:hypothetical protein
MAGEGGKLEELIGALSESILLTEGERQGLIISELETEELRMKSEKCMVGKLMSERRVHTEAFQAMMLRIWKTIESVRFKELHDNLWLLEFGTESDKRRIKEGRPWLFDRRIFVLKELEEHIPPSQMVFSLALFWVQVHDMPLICMNKEVGTQIGESLGEVEEVDVTGDGVGWGRFLRVRVLIDITKPLERGRALKVNERSIWVSFKYEKLPHFCYICGRIVHGSNKCRSETGFRLNRDTPTRSWGAWLRAEDSRFKRRSSSLVSNSIDRKGGDGIGGTFADPGTGGGESSNLEIQSVSLSSTPKEKSNPDGVENSMMEDRIDGTVVGNKEGVVTWVGSKSINAEDSDRTEDITCGDVAKLHQQKEKGMGIVKEGNTTAAEGPSSECNSMGDVDILLSSPGPTKPRVERGSLVHLGPVSNVEEIQDPEQGREQPLQTSRTTNPISMQTDVKVKKMKSASRTWRRRDRESLGEPPMIQGGKTSHAEYVSMAPEAQGPEMKKPKGDKMEMAVADFQPRQSQ